MHIENLGMFFLFRKAKSMLHRRKAVRYLLLHVLRVFSLSLSHSLRSKRVSILIVLETKIALFYMMKGEQYVKFNINLIFLR